VETTFAELLLVVAAAFGLYKLLKPLQARIQAALERFLDPKRRNTIDAEVVPEPPKRRKKDS
jgi:hypothetical protein